MSQPTMNADAGCILVVGGQCNGERWAIVQPVASDAAGLNGVNRCRDAVDSWNAAPQIDFLNICSSDLSITFIQAEGMVPGSVPYRIDFALNTVIGTRAAGALPMNVAGLLSYYEDPSQVPVGEKIRVAKTFIPGLADGDVVGNTVGVGATAPMEQYGNSMQNGYQSLFDVTKKWYRVISASTNPAFILLNIVQHNARDYLATQRRRLTPHQ